MFSPAVRKGLLQKSQVDYEMSLDKIVTEYLRKQHALCRNPVVTCPPMSLFQYVTLSFLINLLQYIYSQSFQVTFLALISNLSQSLYRKYH